MAKVRAITGVFIRHPREGWEPEVNTIFAGGYGYPFGIMNNRRLTLMLR